MPATTAIAVPASRKPPWLPTAAWLFALPHLGFAVVRLAWVGEDAYITFRTVENAVAGHGLRWNVADRRQT